MTFFQFSVPRWVMPTLAVLWLTPAVSVAQTECDRPAIDEREALIRLALDCNGAQQALDARWRSQQYRTEASGRLDDPKLMLGVAPQTFGDERLDDGYIVELSQPLPWPGILSLRKQAADAQTDAWQARLQQGQVNLAKQIRLAYAQWLYHRQLLSINQRHQTLWQEFLAVVHVKYAAGTSTKSAVLQATHEHHLLQQEAIELRAMIERDISELKRLGNLDKRTRLDINETLPVTQLATEQWNAALASLEQQPLMQGLNASIRQKAHEVSLAEKDRYPTFNVSARYNSLWMNDEQRWVVGVGFNLPFDLGKRRSHEDSLRTEQMALRWEQQDLQVQLREILIQAHSHWQQAKDVYGLYQQDLLPLAEENLTTARDEYQSGSGDFLSLLTAQRQLLSTQRKAEQALRDQFAQFAQLLAASGVVFEADLHYSSERAQENSLERKLKRSQAHRQEEIHHD